MKLFDSYNTVINELLDIEHKKIACKLGFIASYNEKIAYNLLVKIIGMLDELSRVDNEKARKIVVTVSSVLWTYRSEEWEGLKDFLILILSRIGFPPSSIMIDESYDFKEYQFSALNSKLDEFYVTLHHLNHEILVGEEKFLITAFQKRVWDKLSNYKLLGISAPTSAGKSFIILLKVIETILHKGGNVIYIVPTLSLVAQVSADFNRMLKIYNLTQYTISTTFNSQEINHSRIYILTQEKAISAFSQSDEPYNNIRVLIVDEIQNLERVANENDQRAKTLYDTLIELRFTCKPDITIISGPRINGLKELGINIFNEIEAEDEETRDSPVASFTYSISKEGKAFYLKQYSVLLKEPKKLKINNDSIIIGYGRSQYPDEFVGYLSNFIKNLGSDARNIIFSPTTKQARKTAVKLAELSESKPISKSIESLVEYIKETVHDEYDMCKTIPKGIVYHHGKVPMHVRAVIERAIKDKMISNVACTTTLMQGVNLPAQNVILRNPDLAIKAKNGIKPKLTDYELANLRGRAGRLLKDFIGRTFILEEDSFEADEKQGELFPEAEKKILSGYGEKYNAFKYEIKEALKTNETITYKNREYSFLLTHIRQVILRHKEKSLQRLSAVGITLSAKDILETHEILKKLEINKEVCLKNRYWDPLDLNALFKMREKYFLPTSVSDQDIANSLMSILLEMNSNFPYYYDKYFSVSEKLLFSTCISATEWLSEKPLRVILESPYFDTPDKVDERISLLQNKISYGLPMLLKPIYDILNPKSMFLRFIEIGAYTPIARKMIELNIPRETAISLSSQYFSDFDDNVDNLEGKIISKLRQIINELDYWRKIQIEGII
ncbi:MAG: hypothetical protein CVV44_22510 [Spirochaetae bacterium HGW-Spirochaetae-1]|jgi:hypothetical protein|nr:MAG: hypothetical protein CVV44_22510 [Spirochaetae bacterium HGW-Spirochaetae-1]